VSARYGATIAYAEQITKRASTAGAFLSRRDATRDRSSNAGPG